MHNSACSGYTVPAAKLAVLLPVNLQKEFLEKIDKHEGEDLEDLQEWFTENREDKNLPLPELMWLRHEDESEDLDYDVIYGYFDESDLFIKVPNEANKALAKLSVRPTLSRWVVWG